jgi:hypothetical protein
MSELITQLTPEQEALLPKFRDEWFKIGSSCEPANRAETERAIIGLYAKADKSAPPFKWVASPLEALKLIADNKYQGDLNQARNEVWNALHGQTNAYWVAFYKYCRDVLNVTYDRNEEFELWMALTENGGWWWPYEETCICCDRPASIAWETDFPPERPPRLHSLTGPAIEFRDGYKIYCIRGIRVQERYITDPMSITPDEIEKETNQEIRRILIERYDAVRGVGSFITDSGAVLVHEDGMGQLFRKELPGDEPICMVRVENATPEPDGHFKIYWIRVPPTVTTAREAVAWTFEETAESYTPTLQT